MAVTVDDLVALMRCRTDQQLANRLGLNRSTIAQWRRRGAVPKHWDFLTQLHSIEAGTLAARRRIFGEGDGYYIHMAAIAVLERTDLDWPMLEPHARAAQIEDRILRAASYIIEVLDERPLKLYHDYENLVRELGQENHRAALQERLTL